MILGSACLEIWKLLTLILCLDLKFEEAEMLPELSNPCAVVDLQFNEKCIQWFLVCQQSNGKANMSQRSCWNPLVTLTFKLFLMILRFTRYLSRVWYQVYSNYSKDNLTFRYLKFGHFSNSISFGSGKSQCF